MHQYLGRKKGSKDFLIFCAGDTDGDGSAKQWPVSPPVVTQLLGTIAAGDSFNAASIATRMQGIGPKEAAGNGAKLAPEVIQHRGTIIKPL